MHSKSGAVVSLFNPTYGRSCISLAVTVYAPVQRAHVTDFLKSTQTRERPVADIEEGHISTACCILANLSDELGRPVRYDPKTRSIIGDAAATQRLTRAYRAPWVHPDPASV
jgi:hypothetical protein